METKTIIITTEEMLDKLIESCKKTKYASFDFETNAEPIYNKTFKPTLLSISFQPGFAAAIPLDHHEAKNTEYCGSGWKWKKVLKKVGHELIENKDIIKVAWNAKFDLQIFVRYGIFQRGTLIDGMLAKYILNEERPNGLKDMVRRYLPEQGDYEKADKFDKIPWDKKPLDQLCFYGGQDTDYTLRLSLFFENRLIELNLYSLYRNLIMPASRVLQRVEKNGLYLDRKFNQKLLLEYEPKIKQARENCLNLPKVKKFHKWYSQQKVDKYLESIENELEDLDPKDPKDKRKISSREAKISAIKAGVFTTKKEQELIRPVNLGSTTDLPLLLFSEQGFNMKPIKNTDKGKPATDEESLVELRLKVKNPESSKAIFLDNLMELRGLEKMYKTYILGWSEKVQDDDCLHGRLLITGTTSGRLSCISAETLILTQHGEIPIKDLENFYSGVMVMTSEGWEPITHFIYKGKDEMYEVTLDDGTTIQCTLDHKFITNKGTKKLREIYNKDRNTIDNNIKLLKYEE